MAKVNGWTDHNSRPISREEEQLYNHLLSVSQSESPTQLVDRFRMLFLDATEYSDPSVRQAIEQIVSSTSTSADFKFILNRCCYILINRWLMHPRLQSSIPALVDLLVEPPSGMAYSRSSQRLRELVRLFRQTDQYLTLRRLADLMRHDLEVTEQNQPLGSYIRRYPYLYDHCLLAEDSGDDQRRTVRRMRIHAQRQFEVDLSQYMLHRLVRSPQREATVVAPTGSELAPATMPDAKRNSVSEPLSAKIDLTPYVRSPLSARLTTPRLELPVPSVKNPTLLSDDSLCTALKQFVGKVDGSYTQRDLAQHFLTYSSQTPSYKLLKEDLYEYLTAAIAPEYGKRQFYDRLYTQLQETLPENNDQPPNEFLLLRTCSRLLNFLVVDNPQQPNHFLFLDLITNVGTTLAINLLLKIVLLCQKVKPHLERRFLILFNHYASHSKDSGIGWLIEALETLNVAFATNFGSINFYCFS